MSESKEQPNTAAPDPSDIVATQGEFLAPLDSTPKGSCNYDEKFVKALDRALWSLDERMMYRREIYRDKTDEDRLGHTPPELRNEHRSERDEMLRIFMMGMKPRSPSAPSTPTMPHSNSAAPGAAPPAGNEKRPVVPAGYFNNDHGSASSSMSMHPSKYLAKTQKKMKRI